jgi:hypothetical protein
VREHIHGCLPVFDRIADGLRLAGACSSVIVCCMECVLVTARTVDERHEASMLQFIRRACCGASIGAWMGVHGTQQCKQHDSICHILHLSNPSPGGKTCMLAPIAQEMSSSWPHTICSTMMCGQSYVHTWQHHNHGITPPVRSLSPTCTIVRTP